MATALTREDLDRIAEKIPPSDPRIEETIYTEYIRKGFIIYDSRKNKAVCTRCGEEWDIGPGEYAGTHGSMDYCPYCCEKGILLSAGRGRKKFTEYHRLLSFAQAEGTIYAFLNSIIVDFSPFGRPSIFRSCDELYIVNKYEQRRYHKKWDYRRREFYYEEINNLRVPAAPTAPYTYQSKWQDHVYTDGLMTMLAESDCRYVLGSGLLLQNRGMDLPSYIGTMMKYHSVELLAKAGFNRLAQWKIDGNGCRCINWRGNSLEKILKLPKGDIRKIREWNPTISELEVYQNLSPEDKRKADVLLIRDMAGFTGSWGRYTGKPIDTYREAVEKYMPFDKWARWVKTQYQYRKKEKYVHLLSDYEDYIRACEKLGRDITKKSILRPADLKAAHDEAVQSVKIAINAAIDKAIAENSRAEEFTALGMMIKAATCQEDLNMESAKLCHCVRTYGDRLAQGKCFIFFIRKTDAPNEPYYTLETRPDGTFVQCRGSHNCSMTDEVEIFKDAFVKKLQSEIKKEARTACQTA